MPGYAIKQWLEDDEKEKDLSWAQDIVRNIRWFMIPVVNADQAATGMAYLFAQQDMGFIRKLFLDAQNTLGNNNTP